jgi:hypothetical protein
MHRLGIPGEERSRDHQLPNAEEVRTRWFEFLQAECGERDGLLCFYDHQKSRQVSSLCQVLARQLLKAPTGDPWGSFLLEGDLAVPTPKAGNSLR